MTKRERRDAYAAKMRVRNTRRARPYPSQHPAGPPCPVCNANTGATRCGSRRTARYGNRRNRWKCRACAHVFEEDPKSLTAPLSWPAAETLSELERVYLLEIYRTLNQTTMRAIRRALFRTTV